MNIHNKYYEIFFEVCRHQITVSKLYVFILIVFIKQSGERKSWAVLRGVMWVRSANLHLHLTEQRSLTLPVLTPPPLPLPPPLQARMLTWRTRLPTTYIGWPPHSSCGL